MAERIAGKAKKRAQKSLPPAAGAAAKGNELAERISELEGELARARLRIKTLEEQREQVINRIDWVIDSLHMLTEE